MTYSQLQSLSKQEGFDAFSVAPVAQNLRRQYYLDWIADGQQGTMEWMTRNLDRRLNPENVLPQARSILCFGLNCYQPQPPERRYKIATYALGKDYHKTIYKKLKRICTALREAGGEQKPYVDTGPVLERPIAASTQLGWQGKNTMLIHPKQGIWLMLGEIFTTLEVRQDNPTPDHCGSCTRCIDACPTGAITAPYQLDARKCLSYLSIEHKGSIPIGYRKAMGDRVFGCDDCLAVCPWNRFATITNEARFSPVPLPDIAETLDWTADDFQAHFAGTPVMRLGLNRWLRNAAVVLGNKGTQADAPALRRLSQHEDPVVAEHAQWAIEQLSSTEE